MKIVFAYNTISEKADDKAKRKLVGRTGKSFNELFAFLAEGDHATVAVPGRGYKTISISGSKRYVQRNYVMEY